MVYLPLNQTKPKKLILPAWIEAIQYSKFIIETTFPFQLIAFQYPKITHIYVYKLNRFYSCFYTT